MLLKSLNSIGHNWQQRLQLSIVKVYKSLRYEKKKNPQKQWVTGVTVLGFVCL